MEIINNVQEMQEKMLSLVNKKVGFVPTMGFLHDGHLSLMKQARRENEIVVASIFVNPLQFGPNEDFEQYPRDEKRDANLAEEVGVDILFIPDVSEMYPRQMFVSMAIEERANVLCGQTRPGHFNGVITVLTKLFHIVLPDQTYFGMKDAQQLAVVDSLINDLNFPINLIGLPTVREEDGLAKSSRNVYLTKDERNEAQWLYKALSAGQQLVLDGNKNPDMIVKEVKQIIKKETNGKIDYVELLSYPDLKPVTEINEQVILAAAVYFKRARLIDNLIFTATGQLTERII